MAPPLPALSARALGTLLSGFPQLRIGVVGDFFLDAYFDCNPLLSEHSLETGRECHQVVRTRRLAGAAGTVAANLTALGVGRVEAVGFCGDDGEGFELRRALVGLGVTTSAFLTASDRVTPTYGKPCLVDSAMDVSEELARLDIRNRTPTPGALQEEIMGFVSRRLRVWHGVVVIDQVSEAGCGVITTRMRRLLSSLGQRHPQKVMLADSRERIGEFRHLIIKPNDREAALACGELADGDPTDSHRHAVLLSERGYRPVFLTRGQRGILVADGGELEEVGAVRITGPIDPVGAGDSASAAIVASLCCGASPAQAATVANLVASLTIQQVGTTGTASRAQVRKRFREAFRGS